MKDPNEQDKVTITHNPDGSVEYRVDVKRMVREEIPEHLREERKRQNRERWMRFPSLRMLLEQRDAREAAKAAQAAPPEAAPPEAKAE